MATSSTRRLVPPSSLPPAPRAAPRPAARPAPRPGPLPASRSALVEDELIVQRRPALAAVHPRDQSTMEEREAASEQHSDVLSLIPVQQPGAAGYRGAERAPAQRG